MCFVIIFAVAPCPVDLGGSIGIASPHVSTASPGSVGFESFAIQLVTFFLASLV